MNYIRKDEFSGPGPRDETVCRCGAQPATVRKRIDPRTGKTARMFECQCGQRSWTDAKQ